MDHVDTNRGNMFQAALILVAVIDTVMIIAKVYQVVNQLAALHRGPAAVAVAHNQTAAAVAGAITAQVVL